MRRVSDTVWLGQLTADVWIHTTTIVLDGVGYYPANGAIVRHGDEAVLIDTAWTGRYTRDIIEGWKSLGQPAISKALVTHFHYDRLGGIDELSKRGIPAYGNPLTIGLAIEHGFAPPRPLHDLEKRAQRFGPLEVYYPGEGHTIDNVVAWIPSDRVLFGGCLVKSTTADDLGNVADAVVPAWPATMRNVARAYSPRHVIPGHGTISGDPIAHTKALADAAARGTR